MNPTVVNPQADRLNGFEKTRLNSSTFLARMDPLPRRILEAFVALESRATTSGGGSHEWSCTTLYTTYLQSKCSSSLASPSRARFHRSTERIIVGVRGVKIAGWGLTQIPSASEAAGRLCRSCNYEPDGCFLSCESTSNAVAY